MNIKINIVLLCCITLVCGIVLYAFHHQWIIFRRPYTISPQQPHIKTKRKCTLYYWHHNRWHTESPELIWSSHTEENVGTLVSHWLSLLDAEQLLPKKIILQSAALTPNAQEVYLSFDRNLIPKEWSIHHKLMLIEGLLKTIRMNITSLHGIHFLVHHQPLIDTHLDFSHAWPIHGFITT